MQATGLRPQKATAEEHVRIRLAKILHEGQTIAMPSLYIPTRASTFPQKVLGDLCFVCDLLFLDAHRSMVGRPDYAEAGSSLARSRPIFLTPTLFYMASLKHSLSQSYGGNNDLLCLRI